MMMKKKKKKRDYKQEHARNREMNIVLSIKVPKEYEDKLNYIKQNGGITKFFIEHLKNYDDGE